MRRRIFGVSLAVLMAMGVSRPAQAGPVREILLTSTYGVLAGGIVGLASLAFVSPPSAHLRNIAMGTSIGLYCGIALGLYVAFAVPALEESKKKSEEEKAKGLLNEDDEDKEDKLPKEPPPGSPGVNDSRGPEPTGFQLAGLVFETPTLAVFPTVDAQTGKIGAGVAATLISATF